MCSFSSYYLCIHFNIFIQFNITTNSPTFSWRKDSRQFTSDIISSLTQTRYIAEKN